jgi:hypothetical protein
MTDKIIYNIVASIAKSLETTFGYELLPGDFEGDIATVPYIVVSVVTSNFRNADHGSTVACNGMVKFVIYTENDLGPKASLDIAENIDSITRNRRFGNIQTFIGSSQSLGVDPVNRSLTRREFSLPFIYYGV